MKRQQRFAAILAAVMILSGSFPMLAVKADQDIVQQEDMQTPVAETTGQEDPQTPAAEISNQEALQTPDTEITGQEAPQTPDTEITGQEAPQTPDTEITEQEISQTLDTEITGQEAPQTPDTEITGQEAPQTPAAETTEQEIPQTPDIDIETSDPGSSETSDEDITDEVLSSDTINALREEMTALVTEDITNIPHQEMDGLAEDGEDYPVPVEPPGFYVRVQRQPSGYVVKGTFTDITPDITQIYPVYSLDGDNWQRVDDEYEWDLDLLGTDDKIELFDLQNQWLGFDEMREPLISYIAGEIDRIYIKLHITKKNGCSYESRIAVIERIIQPLPEEMKCIAFFSAGVVVREPIPDTPSRSREYGRYQLTVSEDATAEEISALLPETLPVRVEIMSGRSIPYASVVVDCPVTWKKLSFPSLSAGDSITISDAAEKIQIPAGTQLKTPLGTFELDTPLSVKAASNSYCDYLNEVELVLNVSQENADPQGVLKEDRDGLKIALYKKATGAVSIKAYVLTEGESQWTEIPGLSLLKELSMQPSTTNSGYALVLRNDQEPYRSYRENAPFFVGLKFEGGIYDGRQLVLAWPDVYDQLPDLPKVGGAGGNEGNAGADNKDDSTESGQRPNLPQTSDEEQENKQQPSEDSEITQPPSEDSKETQQPSEDSEVTQQPSEDSEVTRPPSEDSEVTRQPSENSEITQQSSDDSGLTRPDLIQMPEAAVAIEIPEDQNTSATMESVSEPAPVDQKPEVSESGQRPNLPQITQDTADSSPADQESSRAVEWSDHTVQPTFVVQAATDIKDENGTAVLSDVGAVVEQGREDDNRAPLLPATIAVSAVICISATACKVTGFGLFHRIAGIIRNVLHK